MFRRNPLPFFSTPRFFDARTFYPRSLEHHLIAIYRLSERMPTAQRPSPARRRRAAADPDTPADLLWHARLQRNLGHVLERIEALQGEQKAVRDAMGAQTKRVDREAKQIVDQLYEKIDESNGRMERLERLVNDFAAQEVDLKRSFERQRDHFAAYEKRIAELEATQKSNSILVNNGISETASLRHELVTVKAKLQDESQRVTSLTSRAHMLLNGSTSARSTHEDDLRARRMHDRRGSDAALLPKQGFSSPPIATTAVPPRPFADFYVQDDRRYTTPVIEPPCTRYVAWETLLLLRAPLIDLVCRC